MTKNLFISKKLALGRIFLLPNAVINFIESIDNAIIQDKFKCRIFIDFKKAFDTVDQNILLTKLWHYIIRGIDNDWFKSYFTKRMQYVSVRGILSGLLRVDFGVP